MQQAVLDDRSAWLSGLIGAFLNLDNYLGKRVSEDGPRAVERRGRGVPVRDVGLRLPNAR